MFAEPCASGVVLRARRAGGGEGSINNHAALLVLLCRDDGGSPNVCSSPISFTAPKVLAILFSLPVEQIAKLVGHWLFPSQLIKQINGNYAVHIFRNFLFGCGEVCSYFGFGFADCSNFTCELISAWFLLTTSNCVDYNFLGQTP